MQWGRGSAEKGEWAPCSMQEWQEGPPTRGTLSRQKGASSVSIDACGMSAVMWYFNSFSELHLPSAQPETHTNTNRQREERVWRSGLRPNKTGAFDDAAHRS